VFRCFVHANGAVELRQPPPTSLPEVSTLPPRVGDQGGFTRKNLPSRRVKRPIGGYLPFEKARSYLGGVALFIAIVVVGGTAYIYCSKIGEIQRSTGRSGGSSNIWKYHDEVKRKEYKERQKKALDRLKAKIV
jgi:hypothetical protein